MSSTALVLSPCDPLSKFPCTCSHGPAVPATNNSKKNVYSVGGTQSPTWVRSHVLYVAPTPEGGKLKTPRGSDPRCADTPSPYLSRNLYNPYGHRKLRVFAYTKRYTRKNKSNFRPYNFTQKKNRYGPFFFPSFSCTTAVNSGDGPDFVSKPTAKYAKQYARTE